MNDPTCVSLFSGIGGLDHGLQRAGFRHLAFCESEPYRREVLAARWPGVPVYDDVSTFGTADVRLADGRGERQVVGREGALMDSRQAGTDAVAVGLQDARGLDSPDLLCGGFPCQDLSVAGQRRGLAGDRSGLFHEFARIAQSLRPQWLLVENVPGLLSSQGGRDFGTVLGTLADIGYGVAWRVLDSRFFGVPQRRRRVFIVGALAERDPRAAAERAGEVLAVGSRCPGHPATRGEAREDLASALAGRSASRLDDQGTGQLIANTMKSQRGKGGGGIGPEETLIAAPFSHGSNPNSNAAGRRREDDENLVAYGVSENQRGELLETDYAHQLTSGGGKPGQGYPAVREGASVRRLMPVECERLQALPDGWTDLVGTPDSKRYAALGDAVTASVAEWIGHRIRAALDDQRERV